MNMSRSFSNRPFSYNHGGSRRGHGHGHHPPHYRHQRYFDDAHRHAVRTRANHRPNYRHNNFDHSTPHISNRSNEDQEIEFVKRCLSCEYFSANLVCCTRCGAQLRPDAKTFRNPFKVHKILKDLIDIVEMNEVGPDFLPLQPATNEVLASIIKATNPVATTLPVQAQKTLCKSTTHIKSPNNAGQSDPISSSSKNNCQESRIDKLNKEDAPANTVVSQPQSKKSSKESIGGKNCKNKANNPKPIKLIFIPSDDDDNEDEDFVPSSIPSGEEDNKLLLAQLVSDKKKTEDIHSKSKMEMSAEHIRNTKANLVEEAEVIIDEVVTGKPVEPESILEDQNIGIDKKFTAKGDSSMVRVRLCHFCDSYSFDLKHCSLCEVQFKKKNPKLNPVVELASLSDSELRSVHHPRTQQKLDEDCNESASSTEKASESENVQDLATNSANTSGVTSTEIISTTEIKEENLDESILESISGDTSSKGCNDLANEVESSSDGARIDQNSKSDSIAENPDSSISIPRLTYNPSTSTDFVKQCPRCFSYRHHPEYHQCGFCDKKFTKKVALVDYSTLSKQEKEQSEARHNKYKEDQLKLLEEKALEKVRIYKERELRKVEEFKQKCGISGSSGLDWTIIPEIPFDAEDDENETGNNTNGRKRKADSSSSDEDSSSSQDKEDVIASTISPSLTKKQKQSN